MASLCHPGFTTTKRSYRFPIFETSATALCGTTGILLYSIILYYILGVDSSPFRFTQLGSTNFEPTTMRRQAAIHCAGMVGWRPFEAYFHQTIAIDLLSWSHLTWIVILEVNAGKYTTQLHPNTAKHISGNWKRKQCVHFKARPTWEVLAFAGPIPIRRKFRSQTSDNMDRWWQMKSRDG